MCIWCTRGKGLQADKVNILGYYGNENLGVLLLDIFLIAGSSQLSIVWICAMFCAV